MNDSSSRSHCFAFLTLRALDGPSDTIRTSRFQFVDLAGSERLKEAHGGDASWKEGGEASLLLTPLCCVSRSSLLLTPLCYLLPSATYSPLLLTPPRRSTGS